MVLWFVNLSTYLCIRSLARLHEVHRAVVASSRSRSRVRARQTCVKVFLTTTHQKAFIGSYLDHRYPVSFHCMASGPWAQAREWDWRLKSRTPSKMAILWYSFLEVHNWTTSHQTALVLGPSIPMESNPWVRVRGWG